MQVEISFLIFFAIGFTFLRLDKLAGQTRRKKLIESDDPVQNNLGKKIDADSSLGRFHDVVASWRAAKSDGPTRTDTLKLVAQAFTKVEPSGVKEIVDHISANPAELAHPRVASCILDTVARSGHFTVMHEVSESFRQLNIPFTPQIFEVLLLDMQLLATRRRLPASAKRLELKDKNLQQGAILLQLRDC